MILTFGFNPRTHTGCDTTSAVISVAALVSIHAPTRGATSSRRLKSRHRGFQSTHPHGVRHDLVNEPSRVAAFQSTHPHGVRHTELVAWQTILQVSIHAPTRGATRSERIICVSGKVSIHAPTRGATVYSANV